MTTAASPTLVTLADVAALAHVQRPVVSVWRTRAAGSDAPFPPPALRHGRQELFELADVVSWLEVTGRGNNPEARQDAALVAALDALPEAERPAAVDGLLALLALKTVLGTALSGLAPQDVLDLADDVDPHDLCLHRELSVLGGDVPRWADHADAVAAAAYTPAAAVGALLAQHRRLGLDAVSATVLADAATSLVARLVTDLCDEPGDEPGDDRPHGAPRHRSLAARSGSTRALLVDPTGSGDLLPAIAALRDEPGVVQIPTLTSADARRARRLLLAAGWDVREAFLDDDLVQPPAGATVVAHLPSPTRPAMTDAQVVEAVAGIAATLPADAHAVVLGPASALSNRLSAGPQSARATILRSGRVRAVVRLPAGLWPAQSRRELAVWVLGPGASDVRREDHRTALADMTAVPLDAATVEDLLTDLLAALGPDDALRGHAFRFVQLAVTQSVIATSGDLVSGRTPARRPRLAPAEVALQIRQLASRATIAPPPLPALVLTHQEPAGQATVSLGDLLARSHLHLIQGNRLDPAHLRPAATGSAVPVRTAADLATSPASGAQAAPPTIDRLLLAAHYPRARYTQPGDIVFTTAPTPAAWVDHDGFSVVAAPARVLRLTATAPPGLLPEVIAHAIGRASHRGRWRTWAVPLVPTGQVPALRSALSSIASAREHAARRTATLDSLTSTLLDAVTTGSVRLDQAAADTLDADRARTPHEEG